VLAAATTALAQPAPPAPAPRPLEALATAQAAGPAAEAPTDAKVLEQFKSYRDLLHQENEDFLGLVKLVGGFIGIVGAGLAGFLGFLGWKTLSEARAAAEATVRAQIAATLAKTVEAEVAAARAEIQATVKTQLGEFAFAEAQVRASVFDGARILWVDDRPQNNAGLVRALATEHATVFTALTTDEALQKLKADRDIRLVITDLGRPEGETAGVDLVNRMRTAKDTRPVIVFTGARAARRWWQATHAADLFAVVAGASLLFRAIEGALRGEPKWTPDPEDGLSVPPPSAVRR
jgi:CheY-like chemotaxis protein